VLVGEGSNETRFTVHHGIITKRSSFFRAARSERWTTEKSKPADLQAYEPETFEVYLHCLYHGTVPNPTLSHKRPSPPDMNSSSEVLKKHREQLIIARRIYSDARFKELVDLYVLADILVDPETMNIAIDEIRRFSNRIDDEPSAKVITHAFRSTREGDGLRMLFADYFVFGSSKLSSTNLPKELFHVVGKGFLIAKEEDNITVKDEFPEFFRDVNGSVDWDNRVYYQNIEDDDE
jgi:hypothetical protein